MTHRTREEHRLHRRELDDRRREYDGLPPLLPKGEAYRELKKMWTPPPFAPERDVKRQNWPEDLPSYVREWASLYLDGHSPEAIYAITHCHQKPHTIRRELKKWGVEMRKPGGRNSRGLSLLSRVAELEHQVGYVLRELELITEHVQQLLVTGDK